MHFLLLLDLFFEKLAAVLLTPFDFDKASSQKTMKSIMFYYYEIY